jgi:choline-glycine betaine transporter
MAKTVPSQRSVYIAAAIVIIVTALWAVLFVPRLDMHPEAVKDGAADSSRVFFKFLLAAAVVLLACVILSQLGGRIISGVITGLLYLAAGLVFFHEFMVFNGAVFYLQEYEGFLTEAILMLICVGANLIAAILAIKAGNKYRQSSLPRDR